MQSWISGNAAALAYMTAEARLSEVAQAGGCRRLQAVRGSGDLQESAPIAVLHQLVNPFDLAGETDSVVGEGKGNAIKVKMLIHDFSLFARHVVGIA